MTVYADTSFLVPLYVRDTHTPEALRRMAGHPSVWLTPFHRVEIFHAFEQNVFRGKISAAVAQQLMDDFMRDCNAALWQITGTPPAIFESAIELARAHVARIAARTLDTLHVASALELKAKFFWTFDDRQAKLAKAAGLKVS